ncbi:type I restriction modification DNA specificity domain protein [Acinetobacter baumannii 846928]|uniref:restriction endonuclease subunit S n=1 Tax=Acinetobacter baumannii TaxID=470 RepID=UPI00044D2880|nr:restriction endonuclease subunit S [Acinetobacter baumannii]EXI39158.1 type I restriction modification DNA specificity domain protein [Acinetobacter baumannii 846928]
MTKYQKYAEYKDSGVEALGLIPKGWSILRGKFLFKEINERSESGEETLLSVSEYYGVKPREEKIADGDFLTRAESLEGYKKCYPNDLVMNIMLAWKRGLGVSKYEGIVSPAYSVFRFSEQVNSDYIHYLLRTEEYTKYFKTRSTGIIDSRLRLYPESFGDIFILFPTLEIQTQIANFLDYETTKIDTLIAKQEKLIELLKEKRQAVISHAVTKGLNPNVPMKDSGVEWLGEVPEHWRICRLKHVGYIQSGIAKGKDLTGKTSISVPMLRVANVQDGYLNLDEVHQIDIEPEQLERYLLQNGDVLMNEGGDNDKLGRGAVWHNEIKNCIHQNHVFAIRTTIIEPEWLDILTRASYAKFHFFRQSKQSTNLASISATNIKETPILVPPKNEREQILVYLNRQFDQFSKLENRCYQQVELLKERRTAIISAAVTGKIDVRNWQHSNKNNNQDNMELSA